MGFTEALASEYQDTGEVHYSTAPNRVDFYIQFFSKSLSLSNKFINIFLIFEEDIVNAVT